MKTREILRRAMALLVVMAYPFTTAFGQVEVREVQGISYLAGGVGTEEREAVEKLAHFFNLKLTFAEKAGNYLGDVRVTIRTPEGKPVTEILANGPLLYVALTPGRYLVEATFGAKAQTRTVTVAAPPQKATALFMW